MSTKAKLIDEYQEEKDGILYNVRVLQTDGAVAYACHPVRTPEQQADFERRFLEAMSEYADDLLRVKGFEWCMEHIAERRRDVVEAAYAEEGRPVPDYLQKYLY